jgi:hypothetical protein
MNINNIKKWLTKDIDDLTDDELKHRAKYTVSNIETLIDEVKALKQEFTGTDLNPEGGFFHEMRTFKNNTESELKSVNKKINDIELKYNTIQTGVGIGKWAIGGTLVAFFASNLGEFANWIKKLIA